MRGRGLERANPSPARQLETASAEALARSYRAGDLMKVCVRAGNTDVRRVNTCTSIGGLTSVVLTTYSH